MYFSRLVVLLCLVNVKTKLNGNKKISVCTNTSSHIKHIYFLDASCFSPHSTVVDIVECCCQAEPLLFHHDCFLSGRVEDIRLRLWPQVGSCAWWPGCCSTGWEHQLRFGRCRPPCCCRLCGSAGSLWSWRAWRCFRCLLTSDRSETGWGNICRTVDRHKEKKDMRVVGIFKGGLTWCPLREKCRSGS